MPRKLFSLFRHKFCCWLARSISYCVNLRLLMNFLSPLISGLIGISWDQNRGNGLAENCRGLSGSKSEGDPAFSYIAFLFHNRIFMNIFIKMVMTMLYCSLYLFQWSHKRVQRHSCSCCFLPIVVYLSVFTICFLQ